MLDFIEELLERAEDVPLLVLCLSRPDLLDQRPSWGGGGLDAESIQVTPLSAESSNELIRVLAGKVAEATRRHIATRAEGNPLFIEQLVALAADDPSAPPDAIPLSIHAVLAARVERLESEERALLERASIIGLEFSLSGVAALASRIDPLSELSQVARRLVRKDLLRPAGPEIRGADDEYRFRHLLIRDVVYGSVLKATRTQLHERFARWLEEDLQDRASEVEEIIGYHLERAYDLRKELDPDAEGLAELANEAGERLAAAGRQNVRRSDAFAAIDLLERARALLAAESPSLGDVLADLTYLYRLTGRWAQVRACLDQGFVIASNRADRELAAYLRISELQFRLHTDDTFSATEFARVASEVLSGLEAEGASRYVAQIKGALAWAYALRGQSAIAETLIEEAVAADEDLADARKLLPSLWLAGPLSVPEGITKCEALLDEEPSPRTIASCKRTLAVLRAMRGDFDEARELSRQDRRILDELGLAVLRAASASIEGSIELLAGEPAVAAEVIRRGRAELERLGATMHAAGLAALLGRALLELGREAEAWLVLESSAEASAHDVAYAVEFYGVRARLLLVQGFQEESEPIAREAVAMADETDSLDLKATARVDLAHILEARGRRRQADEFREQARRLYEQKGNLVEAERTCAELGN